MLVFSVRKNLFCIKLSKEMGSWFKYFKKFKYRRITDGVEEHTGTHVSCTWRRFDRSVLERVGSYHQKSHGKRPAIPRRKKFV